MTVSEVEAILGGPARDETAEAMRPQLLIQSVLPDLEWISNKATIWVHLGRDRLVRDCRAIPAPPEQSVVGVVRRWLRM
jgi:hypothetical protein